MYLDMKNTKANPFYLEFQKPKPGSQIKGNGKGISQTIFLYEIFADDEKIEIKFHIKMKFY